MAPQRQEVLISELTEWKNNSRIHTQRNLLTIKNSLEKFGQMKPLIVQKSSMSIIAGNGTFQAMKALGWEKADCYIVDIDDNKAEAYCIVSIVEGEEEEPEILPAPTNVVAMTLNDTGLVLMWDAVEGAEKYNVYNQDELVGSFEEINTQIEGLTPGTEYCFTVTAVDVNGESEKSEEACAKTSGVKPENPESIEEVNTSIQFYPSPVGDKLYIAAEIEVEEVVVYTITGVVVGQQSTDNGQQLSCIDVANLNSGIYFVKVKTANGETVKRIIKD